MGRSDVNLRGKLELKLIRERTLELELEGLEGQERLDRCNRLRGWRG